jgi:GntP family gluconate:H+ symporter
MNTALLILPRSMVGTTVSIPVHIRQTLDLVGHRIIALPIGVGLSLALASGRKMSDINVWISDGTRRAASILAIVGTGGALGTVLQASGIGDVLGNAVASLGVPDLVVVFLVSAMIKTGIGSSMVTWITAPQSSCPFCQL